MEKQAIYYNDIGRCHNTHRLIGKLCSLRFCKTYLHTIYCSFHRKWTIEETNYDYSAVELGGLEVQLPEGHQEQQFFDIPVKGASWCGGAGVARQDALCPDLVAVRHWESYLAPETRSRISQLGLRKLFLCTHNKCISPTMGVLQPIARKQ